MPQRFVIEKTGKTHDDSADPRRFSTLKQPGSPLLRRKTETFNLFD